MYYLREEANDGQNEHGTNHKEKYIGDVCAKSECVVAEIGREEFKRVLGEQMY